MIGTLRDGGRVAACFLPVLLASCAERTPSAPVHEITGGTMGTTFSIKVVAPPAAVDMPALGERLEETIHDLEALFSTWREDSELSRFNGSRETGWTPVSEELCRVVRDAIALSATTGGAFDPTVGPLVNLWGFGPEGIVDAPPDAASIERRRVLTGYRNLDADCEQPALRKQIPELYVDLSAFAKGHAVDRAAEVLESAGIANYLVEIGGELRMAGRNGKRELWSIAVERPIPQGGTVQEVFKVTDIAMATSGDYRNYFAHAGKHYSHLIDPRTGYPVSHSLASVTVLDEHAAVADGLATALLVLGPADGVAFAEEADIAAYFLLRRKDDVEALATRGFERLVTP